MTTRKGFGAPGGAAAPKPRKHRVGVHDYRQDPLYPRVAPAVTAILATGKVVAPVDVLLRMNLLRPQDLEDWRIGRVPYLERVIQGNLSRLSRLLRILGFLCHDLKLGPVQAGYVRWGDGPRTPLRFTKTGDAKLEKIYARHFVWPGKGPFHPPREKVPAKPPRTDAS